MENTATWHDGKYNSLNEYTHFSEVFKNYDPNASFLDRYIFWLDNNINSFCVLLDNEKKTYSTWVGTRYSYDLVDDIREKKNRGVIQVFDIYPKDELNYKFFWHYSLERIERRCIDIETKINEYYSEIENHSFPKQYLETTLKSLENDKSYFRNDAFQNAYNFGKLTFRLNFREDVYDKINSIWFKGESEHRIFCISDYEDLIIQFIQGFSDEHFHSFLLQQKEKLNRGESINQYPTDSDELKLINQSAYNILMLKSQKFIDYYRKKIEFDEFNALSTYTEKLNFWLLKKYLGLTAYRSHKQELFLTSNNRQSDFNKAENDVISIYPEGLEQFTDFVDFIKSQDSFSYETAENRIEIIDNKLSKLKEPKLFLENELKKINYQRFLNRYERKLKLSEYDFYAIGFQISFEGDELELDSLYENFKGWISKDLGFYINNCFSNFKEWYQGFEDSEYYSYLKNLLNSLEGSTEPIDVKNIEFGSDSHKIIFLNELGIIEHLKNKYKITHNSTEMTTLVAIILNITDTMKVESIRKNLSYLDKNVKKSIYTKKALNQVNAIFAKLGFEQIISD